ncbi:MAG TPA: NAD(P)-dependent oxidoreductase [bacterium]|nr:NAD(P)-dependent oxidoreductase [bacterium]
MAKQDQNWHTIGWIGTGRMGFPMAARLLQAGCDVQAFNRTRSKAEPLVKLGATLVSKPADLVGRDIVFLMVGGPEDLEQVTLGADGLLTRKGAAPRYIVDCSSVSQESSARVRAAAAKRGTGMLAAPVSGNGKVVKAGKLGMVASGPREVYELMLPYLRVIAAGVTYVGEGEVARMVKICHNVFLGVVSQALAEVTVLAEKGGVPRHAFLEFINKSVVGSVFTRYKSPALVKLDFTPMFTSILLRKDLDLGLEAARALEVPLPVAALTRELLQALIGDGYAETDFAALLLQEARGANLRMTPEDVPVNDGLEPPAAGPA